MSALARAPVVFLVDVDNARLDNDRVTADLRRHLDYSFANRLYPGSLDVLERFRSWGPTVILSDGDIGDLVDHDLSALRARAGTVAAGPAGGG